MLWKIELQKLKHSCRLKPVYNFFIIAHIAKVEQWTHEIRFQAGKLSLYNLAKRVIIKFLSFAQQNPFWDFSMNP